MNPLTKEARMLGEFHERQLKTLEQGINDISVCVRRNKLYIVFLYDDQTVYGTVIYMNDKYLTIKNKNYYFDKIGNIFSYFTLQKLPLVLIRFWYETEDEEIFS
jgi:hypothetical protein